MWTSCSTHRRTRAVVASMVVSIAMVVTFHRMQWWANGWMVGGRAFHRRYFPHINDNKAIYKLIYVRICMCTRICIPGNLFHLENNCKAKKESRTELHLEMSTHIHKNMWLSAGWMVAISRQLQRNYFLSRNDCQSIYLNVCPCAEINVCVFVWIYLSLYISYIFVHTHSLFVNHFIHTLSIHTKYDFVFVFRKNMRKCGRNSVSRIFSVLTVHHYVI